MENIIYLKKMYDNYSDKQKKDKEMVKYFISKEKEDVKFLIKIVSNFIKLNLYAQLQECDSEFLEMINNYSEEETDKYHEQLADDYVDLAEICILMQGIMTEETDDEYDFYLYICENFFEVEKDNFEVNKDNLVEEFEDKDFSFFLYILMKFDDNQILNDYISLRLLEEIILSKLQENDYGIANALIFVKIEEEINNIFIKIAKNEDLYLGNYLKNNPLIIDLFKDELGSFFDLKNDFYKDKNAEYIVVLEAVTVILNSLQMCNYNFNTKSLLKYIGDKLNVYEYFLIVEPSLGGEVKDLEKLNLHEQKFLVELTKKVHYILSGYDLAKIIPTDSRKI